MDFVEPVTEDDDSEVLLRVRRSGLQRRSGNSGYRCEECGDAIPEDRRQAEPGTEHCVDCVYTLKVLMSEARDDL